MVEHDGGIAAGSRARRGLPAWVFMTTAGALALVLLVAVGFSAAHVKEGGGSEIYAFPAGVGALAIAAAVLGYRRLPAGVGRWGRPLTILLIAAVGGGVLAAITDAIEESGDGEVVMAPWVIAAAIGLGIWGSLAIWRLLDEAAREAHKWAWYWGSSVGVALALPLFLLGEQSADYRSRLGIGDGFDDGVITVLVLEVVCYALAWVFWWARRR
jgi:hypothetical protein